MGEGSGGVLIGKFLFKVNIRSIIGYMYMYIDAKKKSFWCFYRFQHFIHALYDNVCIY